jgi:hypothetical protein
LSFSLGLQIFVRHSKDCPHRDDYFYKKCKCPKHLRWRHNGKQMTTSAKTRSWAEAEKAKRSVEDEFGKGNTSESGLLSYNLPARVWYCIARVLEIEGISEPKRRKPGAPGVPHFIISTMDTTEIIQTIDAEIARLERARALLNGHTSTPKRGRPASLKTVATPKPQRRTMSAEGRARIAAAQKARWAKAKGK